MHRLKTWATIVAAIALPAAGYAAGSGSSGGGGSMPSASAPSYDPAAEYAKGIAALRISDYRTAERALDKVVKAAPRDPNAWFLLGLARTGQDDWKGARKAYERALKYDPERVAAHQQLGVTLARLNEPEKARASLDTLKARQAACAEACPEAADLKAAVATVEAAVAPPTAAAAPGPGAALEPPSLLFADPAAGDRAYVRAVALINERRYDAALKALGEAATAFGPHPDVLTYIGYTHRRMGRLDVAETHYRQALAIDPGHRGATEYFGELKVERGDMAGARRLLAQLEDRCAFGCAEAEELRRWIDAGRDPAL